ncbi:hypothetical protein BT69DRAFT_1279336 [Atractiella rhizophila]|nr:hypothetical protein BT69DRAFT_1279336 [Atractiella rhizophila]
MDAGLDRNDLSSHAWKDEARDAFWHKLEQLKKQSPDLGQRRQFAFQRYCNFCTAERVQYIPIDRTIVLAYLKRGVEEGVIGPEKIQEEVEHLNWANGQMQATFFKFFDCWHKGPDDSDQEINDYVLSVRRRLKQEFDPSDPIRSPWNLAQIRSEERRREDNERRLNEPFYPLAVNTRSHPVTFLKDLARSIGYKLYSDEKVEWELYLCGADQQAEVGAILGNVFRQHSKASVHCYESIMKRYGKFCKDRSFQVYPITVLKVVLFFQSEAMRPIRKRQRFSDTSGPVSTLEKTKISSTTLKNYSHYLNFCRKGTVEMFRGTIDDTILDAEIPEHALFRAILHAVLRQEKEEHQVAVAVARPQPYPYARSVSNGSCSPSSSNDDGHGQFFYDKRNLGTTLSARDMVPRRSQVQPNLSPSLSPSPPVTATASAKGEGRKGSISSLMNPMDPSAPRDHKPKPGSIASLLN